MKLIMFNIIIISGINMKCVLVVGLVVWLIFICVSVFFFLVMGLCILLVEIV